MKDVSQELDPDTHKQMEKFRKVWLTRLANAVKTPRCGDHDRTLVSTETFERGPPATVAR